MTRKSGIFAALFIMAMGCLSAQTLTIRIENADVGKGHLMVGVFNDEKSFPNEYFKGERLTVSGSAMTVAFSGLPKGRYAVSVYQDANDNGQLDKNFLGIPKEKYGFSNNADRPDFRKCLFDFTDDLTVTIRLK